MTHVFRPDPNDPEAYGVCANSGKHYPRSQLIKQMDYLGGAGPTWTGRWVHPDHADALDTANRESPQRADPEGVRHPLPEPRVTGSASDNTLYAQMPNGDYYDLWAGPESGTGAAQVLRWN